MRKLVLGGNNVAGLVFATCVPNQPDREQRMGARKWVSELSHEDYLVEYKLNIPISDGHSLAAHSRETATVQRLKWSGWCVCSAVQCSRSFGCVSNFPESRNQQLKSIIRMTFWGYLTVRGTIIPQPNQTAAVCRWGYTQDIHQWSILNGQINYLTF